MSARRREPPAPHLISERHFVPSAARGSERMAAKANYGESNRVHESNSADFLASIKLQVTRQPSAESEGSERPRSPLADSSLASFYLASLPPSHHCILHIPSYHQCPLQRRPSLRTWRRNGSRWRPFFPRPTSRTSKRTTTTRELPSLVLSAHPTPRKRRKPSSVRLTAE